MVKYHDYKKYNYDAGAFLVQKYILQEEHSCTVK